MKGKVKRFEIEEMRVRGRLRLEHSRPSCLGILVRRHLCDLGLGRYRMCWVAVLLVECLFVLWVRGRVLMRRYLARIGCWGRGLYYLPFQGRRLDLGLLW